MLNVKILDCTLRDGGRVLDNDCNFSDRDISSITDKLSRAMIDIVELGFLRDPKKVQYSGNSTFFTDTGQIKRFIPQNNMTVEYVAFIDYSMYDFSILKTRENDDIHGLRIGFTKNDYENQYDELVAAFETVKSKGYKLFIQGVNTLNYSDYELLQIVEVANFIKPVSFGIVDTFGAMYVDDVYRLYSLVDHNLDSEIAIDFHSHNNFQLSYSFAQEVIKLSRGIRKVIIDSTLDGMGRGAGNLNTELIVDYLTRKMGYGYNVDLVFDAIDEHIYDFRQKYRWGYSPNTLLSGIYQSHPNNVIYLAEKFRLDTKDIKNVLLMHTDKERQDYDYAKIDHLIANYTVRNYDDSKEITQLSSAFANRVILVLSPGKTLLTHADIIDDYIANHDPVIISVNFVSKYKEGYGFFANKKRYRFPEAVDGSKIIYTSNLSHVVQGSLKVNYHELLNNGYRLYDNSVFMLLNLLRRLSVKRIAIAGLDGFYDSASSNYFDASFDVERLNPQFEEINNEIQKMLVDYIAATKDTSLVTIITPSIFDDIPKSSWTSMED